MALCISNLFTVIAIQYIRVCSHYILLPTLQMINIQLLTIIPKKSYSESPLMCPSYICMRIPSEYILKSWDFSGGPVVKTPCLQRRGKQFYPWLGKIPHAARPPTPQKTLKTYSRAELLVTGYAYTFTPEINIILKTFKIGVQFFYNVKFLHAYT